MTNASYSASHLSFIQTMTNRPLTIFLPTVYRHMDQQFTQEFERGGHLRISSFATFKQHKDENRGDRGEGLALNVLNDAASGRHFGAMTVSGSNAFVLSVTSRNDHKISEAFGSSRLQIIEPIGFCAEVANEIPGCTAVMISQCLYADDKVLLTEGKTPGVDDLRDEKDPEKISLKKIMISSKRLVGAKAIFFENSQI